MIDMLKKVYEIYDKTKDIKYGWTDKNGNIYEHIQDGLEKKFVFQSTEQIEKSRVGICWETVELSRKYLEDNNIPCKTYFFVIPNGKFYCHSILVFKANDKYYWFENSFVDMKGIKEFNSLDEVIYCILDNFKKIVNGNDFNINNIKIYEYNKPKDGTNCVLFYFHCFRGKNITKKYLINYLNSIEEKNK